MILAAPAGFEIFSKGQKQWFRNVMTVEGVKKTTVEAIQTNLYYNFYKMPKDAEFMFTDRIKMCSASDFHANCYAIVQSVHRMVNQSILPYLEQFKQPVLILFGENDNLIPNRFLNPGFTKKIAESGQKSLPHSQLIMIPKTGHFVQFEAAETFNDAIENYLGNNE